MGVLTEEMQRVILEQRLGFHATVRPDGTPNLSPKGTTTVWDDGHLLFADIRSPDTIANLRENAAIEVNVVDPILRKGWRFRGSAELHDGGETYARGLALLGERGYDATPERIRTIALIRVQEATELVSPAYDDGASEDDVRSGSLERLALAPALQLPQGFVAPSGLEHERFRLRMLSIADVDADFEAIRERVAPDGTLRGSPTLTREQNLIDLGWHEKEFQLRRSFAYTVLAPDESRVLGCVYVYPDAEADALVRLWVRQDAWEAGLDPLLERAVRDWIETQWPFKRVRWPERD